MSELTGSAAMPSGGGSRAAVSNSKDVDSMEIDRGSVLKADTDAKPAASAPGTGPQNTTRNIPAPIRDALSFWGTFIDKCIRDRLDTVRFETFVRLVYAKHKLPPTAIADLTLRPSANNSQSPDPRTPLYLQSLGTLGYIDAPSILKALYKYSSSHAIIEARQVLPPNEENGGNGAGSGGDQANNSAKENKPLRWENSYWAEDHIFYALIKWVIEGRAMKDSNGAIEMVKIISKWMSLFTSASAAFAADLLGEFQKFQVEMESSRAGLVAVLMCIRENPLLLLAISKPKAKKHRKELAQTLINFVPTLHLGNSITERDILEKLEHFRTVTLASLDPEDEKKRVADASVTEMLDSAMGLANYLVEDVPLTNTRAGLCIHLSALLVGRPLIDDVAFFGYLTNRYQGDAQAAAIDLILASFDILANAVARTTAKEDAPLLRSFLVNKVPLLLCQLLPPGFSMTSSELCITQALSQVDTEVFPTASLMFDESRHHKANPFTESAREEFCAACVLHGLIAREHVERILGEMSMGYEPRRYKKDELVQEYLSQTDKIKGIVADLDKMDGNVGAVSQALVEVIRQLCHGRDTMSLKMICAELAQRPQSLDILLLFEKLITIITPICQLLDKWHYEEDQAEYQPVYEEFGAILLLVLAFTNRYNLSTADLGLYSAKSKVRRILSLSHVLRHMNELTEQENKHIGGWIHGLFDSEAGGLGDELMSSCPPHEFYLIVAPLFYNVVGGYARGLLTDESLKSGVEYCVDTFLLPSLVPAIKFLAEYLWMDGKEQQRAIIKVLQLMLLPTSISNEARSMLASVKKIVAKPLKQALQVYQQREPNNKDVQALLDAIAESLPQSSRTAISERTEIDHWAQASPGGLWGSIRVTTQTLAQWGVQCGIQVDGMPRVYAAMYNHRQLIAATRLMTANRVLGAILAEVKSQSEENRNQSRTGGLDVNDMRLQAVYEVAVALICAPTDSNEPGAPDMEDHGGAPPPMIVPIQRMLTLRDALRLESQRWRRIQSKDPMLADIIVRLYRKVEAQMAVPAAGPMLQAADMTNLGIAGAPEVSIGDAMAAMQGEGNVGLGVTGIGMDGLGGPSGSGVNGGAGGDGDIFGGLGGGLGGADVLDDFDWGAGMDLN